MRIMLFFDLPVKTEKERKVANQFRRFLINDGYYMVQFSVYARLCNNVENAEYHCHRLSKVAPEKGSIRVMVVTEKQYVKMKIIAGEIKTEEKDVKNYQITFF